MEAKNRIYRVTGLCLALILMLSTVSGYQSGGSGTSTQPIQIEEDGYETGNTSHPAEEEIACAMDAKQCPDGSYVGRVPPNCEFAPCPDSGVTLDVSTDKAEYTVGDRVKISAKLVGTYREADVWAIVEYPSGEVGEIDFGDGICAAAACMCVEGEVCNCPPPSCYYEASMRATQEGAYYITAYAEGEDFELKDRAKFLAYSGSSPEVRFSVYVDREEYRVGDRARITATLSGYQRQGIEDADVWAVVEYPSGVSQRTRLESTVCAASACACPEGAMCKCPPATVSCQFENKISVSQEGAHYVTAYAEGDDFEKKADTKFWAYDVSDTKYVRLDQKFGLEVEQSAVVTDYREMRLTLDNIVYPKCAVLEEDSSSEASVKCLDSRGYAVLSVRGPALAGSEVTETQVRIREGESASLYGAKISLLDLQDDEATFVVSKEGNGDYVDVKIEPSTESVELGQTAKYRIIVRDNHPMPLAVDELPGYSYRVKVYDLPFSLEYDAWVEVGAGREATVPLYVYTSGHYGVMEQAEVATAAAGSGQPQAVQVQAMNTVSAEAAAEQVKIAPDLVASGRAYKFRVAVSGEDDSQDSAYAILNVLYSPPPPPPSDEVEMELSQGWNLIALPGEGTLLEGDCEREPQAYVYLKSREEYVTLKEAAGILGNEGLKDYLRTHSFWVYSYKSCEMRFRLDEATSLHDLSLDEGWNFLPVTQDMEGNSLNGIGGDCDFGKSYYWDSRAQNWERMSLDDDFEEDMLYKGFVANVEDSCDFGWGAILAPPPIPTG